MDSLIYVYLRRRGRWTRKYDVFYGVKQHYRHCREFYGTGGMRLMPNLIARHAYVMRNILCDCPVITRHKTVVRGVYVMIIVSD